MLSNSALNETIGDIQQLCSDVSASKQIKSKSLLALSRLACSTYLVKHDSIFFSLDEWYDERIIVVVQAAEDLLSGKFGYEQCTQEAGQYLALLLMCVNYVDLSKNVEEKVVINAWLNGESSIAPNICTQMLQWMNKTELLTQLSKGDMDFYVPLVSLIYDIASTSLILSFFHHNDLRVLVDLCIRESRDNSYGQVERVWSLRILSQIANTVFSGDSNVLSSNVPEWLIPRLSEAFTEFSANDESENEEERMLIVKTREIIRASHGRLEIMI